MALYKKFEDFVFQLGKGTHQLHAAGHTLKFYASNATPSASADTIKSELAEITAENGYPSGGEDATNDYTETSGVGTLTGSTVTWTATGGTFGPLQYIVLYNDTPTSPADPLIAWWDLGSSPTIQDTGTFTVSVGASIFVMS